MTKPECSKQSPTTNNNQIEVADEIDDDNEAIEETPKSARDLFSDFIPDQSESEDDDDDDDFDEDSTPPKPKKKRKADDYEAPLKKTKESSTPKKTKSYAPKYRKEWENKPELKPWLSESIHGNTYFYCKLCKKDYRCGISDINKHMSSKKHSQRAAIPSFMAQKFHFKGLLCPVFTPFANLKRVVPDVDYKSVEKYSDFLSAVGVKGVLVNDFLGEGMSLTIKERMYLVAAWAETCEKNDQFLMAQIGGAPLKDIIEMALHAKKVGVGAVVLLPDLYNRPTNHLELIRYLKVIAEYLKGTPMLYHHHPKYTKVDIDINAFLVDIVEEIDGFVGIIYTTNNLKDATSAMAVNPEKCAVFVGTDEAILGAAASGFVSIMSASLNFLPKIVESICVDVKNGKVVSAQHSQHLLNKTIDAILKQGGFVASLKAATDIITGTCGVTTREPNQTLWEGTVKKLQLKLKEIGVTV